MITAKEAAELSGPSAEDYLAFLESKIVEAAKKKCREVTIRENPYAYWLYDSSECPREVAKAITTLREKGYKLELYYQEHSIAVDMALVIKW